MNDIIEEMKAAYGIEGCGCYQCVSAVISQRPFPENMFFPFIVCETCGNKRCPRAEFHENECSGSNEPGQPGSVRYPAHVQREALAAMLAHLAEGAES